MKKNEIYKIGRDLGIDDNKIEKIILKITGLSKSQLFLCDIVDEKYIENIKEYFKRTNKGEPIEYIINNAEFYGLNFYVDNRVLVPRNDTEVMVDKVLVEINENKDKITFIDVGTGSCCIAISVLKNTKSIKNCYVIDISKDALEVSKINIQNNGLKNKIKIIKGDLLNPLLTAPYIGSLGTYQWRNIYKINENVIITANLPYIKDGDFENMEDETIKYEPDIALYGGKNTGFEMYEKLINHCTELKNIYKIDKLILFIEIGFDQKEVCKKYIIDLGLQYELFNDNSLIERCVKIIF